MPAFTPSALLLSSRSAGRRLAVVGLGALLIGAGWGASGASAQDKPQRLPRVQLEAGMHRISAEVALTPEQRAIGLMHRSSLGTHEGMLFVFESPSQQCFWMKNTLIPLSIAFLDDEGRVVNIEEMKAQSLESHCSARPVRYALEMNTGWFSRRGVAPGFRLSGGPFKAAAAGS